MSAPRTIVVTGSASGMGAATVRRLADAGHRVIGVDLHDATVTADFATAEGRRAAVEQVTELAGGPDGAIDGLVTWAGLAGLTDRPGSLLAAVNHFGTVAVLEGLRPLLAKWLEDSESQTGTSNSMEKIAASGRSSVLSA